jgi:hemolysin D
VLVKDGDAVQQGQVLVEPDATNASADGASVQDHLSAALSEERRTRQLMNALRTGKATTVVRTAVLSGR